MTVKHRLVCSGLLVLDYLSKHVPAWYGCIYIIYGEIQSKPLPKQLQILCNEI